MKTAIKSSLGSIQNYYHPLSIVWFDVFEHASPATLRNSVQLAALGFDLGIVL
jgi:hypothetical protein